jgi:hypothetical protein
MTRVAFTAFAASNAQVTSACNVGTFTQPYDRWCRSKTRGDERTQRELEAHRRTFPSSCFKLTRIGCRMFWLTETNISRSELSAMVTYEHVNSMLSSTFLQLIGGGGEPGEPGRSSPTTPGPATFDDSGTGIASPEVVLLSILRPTPRTIKSWSRPPTSLPSWGPAPSTLTWNLPSDAPSTPDSSQTRASYKRVASHPSCTGITDTSRTCGIDTYSTPCTDSPSTSAPWGAAASREELEGTMVRSPMLIATGATRGECGDVTRRTTGR